MADTNERLPLQIGHATRITYKGNLTAAFPVPPPSASLDPTSAAYKAQVDQVLALSAGLTEVQKLQVSWHMLYGGKRDSDAMLILH